MAETALRPAPGRRACVPTGGRRATLRRLLDLLLLLGALVLAPALAVAKDAVPAADDPVLEARMLAIATELRCLVCQNQTIADSHAELAQDLRRQVREMLQRGDSNEQILAYMTARYGDFVLYRPPVKATTALLWYGPALLMVAGLATLLLVLRRRARMSPDRFDPDEPDADAEADADARPS
jgi:cytochrome c-type biogenesis protein CcmH